MPPIQMTEYAVTPAHLSQMEQITVASSASPGRHLWTELAIYYRQGFNRPFVAVVRGMRDEHVAPEKHERFKHMTAGTLERALSWFESGSLSEQLALGIPIDADTRYPSSNEAARVDRIPVGNGWEAVGKFTLSDEPPAGTPIPFPIMAPGDRIQTIKPAPAETLRDCLIWLYPDATSNSAFAALMEADFGMPARTVRRALQIEGGAAGEQGAWVSMFIRSMHHFDRAEWMAEKEEAARNKAGAGADNLATIANDEG